MSRGLTTALQCGALVTSLLLTASAAALDKATCERRHAPRIGEAGKDVIWVPTLDSMAEAMLKAANVTPDDYVIDLGAGDGKLAIMAAKRFGARSLGVEYNAQLVKLARCYVEVEGVGDRVEIREADIFATDFSRATVLTLYLLSELNLKLRPTILQMKPGTRVVSNTFKMGEWSPDQFIESGIGNTRAYLWIVPAKVGGTWRFTEEGGEAAFRVQLKQHYQELQGVLLGSSRTDSLRHPQLRGERIEFTLTGLGDAPLALRGVVQGDVIRATAQRRGRSIVYVGRRE